MLNHARALIVLCVVLGMGAIWVACAARVRALNAQFRIRLEGRLRERERISLERQDGLLQGLQGLLYEFQAVADRLSPSEPARARIESTLSRADDLIAKARQQGAESANVSVPSMNLGDALASIAGPLAMASGIAFRASVQGSPVLLHPLARDELFRIGAEALQNAFTHSMASRVELELVYDRLQLLLRIRDDGCGFDVRLWKAGSRTAHFGLIGMQERARRLHSCADTWSRPGSGTEISVRVAADRAYRTISGAGWRGWLSNMYSALRATD